MSEKSAQFAFNHNGQIFCVGFDLAGVFAFHHNAAQRFCARVAQQYPAATSQVGLDLGNSLADGGPFLEGQPFFHTHVDKYLRERLERIT